MMDDRQAGTTHEGYSVAFGQTFEVDFRGELGKGKLNFDTYRGAVDAINTHITALAKDRRLALEVLVVPNPYSGARIPVEGVVTGINLHTSKLTGVGVHDRSPEVYPREQWIVDAVAERERLRHLQEEIQERLSQVALSFSRRSINGHNIDASNYGEALDRLEAEYREKCALAAEEEAL